MGTTFYMFVLSSDSVFYGEFRRLEFSFWYDFLNSLGRRSNCEYKLTVVRRPVITVLVCLSVRILYFPTCDFSFSCGNVVFFTFDFEDYFCARRLCLVFILFFEVFDCFGAGRQEIAGRIPCFIVFLFFELVYFGGLIIIE